MHRPANYSTNKGEAVLTYFKSEKRSIKRVIAFLVCIAFIIVTLSSVAFLITHANHKHNHSGQQGDCTVCVHVSTAKELLKNILMALVGSVLALSCFSTILFALKLGTVFTGSYTLVRLKAKLSN